MIKSSPKASVLMSVLDEDPVYLERALDSILSQTFADFELILIDDGSTRADTRASLDACTQRDQRVRLLRGPNRGLASALNWGLTEARAPLIFRHDSDDWSHPERFSRQRHFLSAHPDIVILGTACQLYQESDGRAFARCRFPADAGTIKDAFATNNPFAHGAVCFRRAAVVEVGSYRERLTFAEDYDLFWRLCERWPGSNLQEVLYHRLIKASSMTARRAQDRQVIVHTIQLLAQSRAAGSELSFDDAYALAVQSKGDPVTGLASGADELMRAGYFRSALKGYLQALLLGGVRPRILVKLARLLVYAAMPGLRYRLFVEKGERRLLPPAPPDQLSEYGLDHRLVQNRVFR